MACCLLVFLRGHARNISRCLAMGCGSSGAGGSLWKTSATYVASASTLQPATESSCAMPEQCVELGMRLESMRAIAQGLDCVVAAMCEQAPIGPSQAAAVIERPPQHQAQDAEAVVMPPSQGRHHGPPIPFSAPPCRVVVSKHPSPSPSDQQAFISWIQIPPSPRWHTHAIETDYIIDKCQCVGTGQYGRVYRGESVRTPGRHVAIKAIDRSAVAPAAIDREVEIMAALRAHPNIVRLGDVYHSSAHTFLVMEYMPGGELLQHLVARGAFTEDSARGILADILSAVAHMHSNHIVHRDLKPENILLTSDSSDARAKVADFGISVRLVNSNDRLHSTSGTWAYCAPEMGTEGGYSTAVDMWAVGVIAYSMLGGVHPFDPGATRTEDEIMEAARRGDWGFHGMRWESISVDAKDFISCLLKHDDTMRLAACDALEHPWMRASRRAGALGRWLDAGDACSYGNAPPNCATSPSEACRHPPTIRAELGGEAKVLNSSELEDLHVRPDTTDNSPKRAQSDADSGSQHVVSGGSFFHICDGKLDGICAVQASADAERAELNDAAMPRRVVCMREHPATRASGLQITTSTNARAPPGRPPHHAQTPPPTPRAWCQSLHATEPADAGRASTESALSSKHVVVSASIIPAHRRHNSARSSERDVQQTHAAGRNRRAVDVPAPATRRCEDIDLDGNAVTAGVEHMPPGICARQHTAGKYDAMSTGESELDGVDVLVRTDEDCVKHAPASPSRPRATGSSAPHHPAAAAACDSSRAANCVCIDTGGLPGTVLGFSCNSLSLSP